MKDNSASSRLGVFDAFCTLQQAK